MDPILKTLLKGTNLHSKKSKPVVESTPAKPILEETDEEYVAAHDIKTSSEGSIPDVKLLTQRKFEKLLASSSGNRFAVPTPIQRIAIPMIGTQRDGIFVAPTGSGKTLAYVLGCLQNVSDRKHASILIVAPTKELARQIQQVAQAFAPAAVINKQYIGKAKKSNVILVCTPLMLPKIGKAIDLSHLQALVFDEADRLLDKDFLEQCDKLISCLPAKASIQKLLFSATMPLSIESMAKGIMQVDYVKVVIGRHMSTLPNIRQSLVFVGQEEGRLIALRNMIAEGKFVPPALIFCKSIPRANRLDKLLRENLMEGKEVVQDKIAVMHAQLEDNLRERTMQRFRQGSLWFLITTDLMARGLDFLDIQTVINYDVPEDTSTYIHRIGRTGRAGKSGTAVTFYGTQDRGMLPSVVKVMVQSGQQVEEWMKALVTRK